ncbi:uncharacterized protein LOC113352628 [Papaver somniferum]|uniref:uncharacterized protein LOC113352628 n=1 Tax=Papaver somniferum TaxID=3469 RepID=UPI000E6FA5BB|nr:uncharacterized protein LOC113352628 [Papaver somniferum]
MHHKHVKLLARTLGIKFLSTSEKYLGTPLFVNRDKTKTFQFLIDKFYSRLSNCKKTNLNVAGRTVVTKHVLSSLAVYHMSSFLFPKNITSKIDSIQRTFWWSKKDPRRAAYYRSWGDIGKSKLNGGLGIKNSFATNRVFIAKIGWRLYKNTDHLVSKFFKDKYYPNQNLLEIDKAVNSASWTWKGIVKGLIIFFIKLMMNISLITSLFSQDVVNKILALRINTSKHDTVMWAHTRNGIFTIKSAYKVYMNESITPEDASFWKKVWSLDCLPKIKFFMWNFFAYMLSVNSLLMLYNPAVDDSCPLCKNESETVMHLFFKCPMVVHIWFALSLQHLVVGI